MIKVVILIDFLEELKEVDSQEFQTVREAKEFIEMVSEYGVTEVKLDYFFYDITVYYDYSKKAFIIQAAE